MTKFRPSLFAFALLCYSCSQSKIDSTRTIASVMDSVITRLYAEVPQEKYNAIDDTFILEFLSSEEKHVLATQYQYFTVNVTVIVSVIRDVEQKVVPFWLEPSGFKKTKLFVKNEGYTYEVWQKNFEDGVVSLGINGSGHRS